MALDAVRGGFSAGAAGVCLDAGVEPDGHYYDTAGVDTLCVLCLLGAIHDQLTVQENTLAVINAAQERDAPGFGIQAGSSLGRCNRRLLPYGVRNFHVGCDVLGIVATLWAMHRRRRLAARATVRTAV